MLASLHLDSGDHSRIQEHITQLEEMNRGLRAEVIAGKRSEEALRLSEMRWYAIFAQAAVGLAEISLQGKFERVNDKLCDLLGRSRSGLLATNIAEVTHHDHRDLALIMFRQVIATGESESVDQQYVGSDGGAVWANVRMTLLENGAGAPRAVLCVATDLTDRKRAEMELFRSEAEFRTFFELAAVGIAQVDTKKKKFLRVNRQFTEMTGYNEFELRRMYFTDLGRPEENRHNSALFDRLMAGELKDYSLEKQLRRKDGTRIWVNVTTSLIRDSQQRPTRTMAVVQDISDRKLVEDKLRRAHEELELRVRERTAELDKVNRILMAEIIERKRAEDERQEVLRRLVTAQEEERRRISRELHDEIGQHLTALMLGLKAAGSCTDLAVVQSQMLKLQQITAVIGKEIHELALELRPTALDDLGLARALTNYLEEWAALSKIEVDFHSIGLDEERLPSHLETTLYRIIQEALNNVLKHASAKHVSVILERRADQAIGIIEDDGCGFEVGSPENQNTQRHLGLLGMGERAALVRGELSVESSPGQGTTVFVRLPLPTPPISNEKETLKHG